MEAAYHWTKIKECVATLETQVADLKALIDSDPMDLIRTPGKVIDF